MALGHVWNVLGLILLSFTTVLILLAFSTPNWVETNDGTMGTTQFEKLGLWEACFDGYTDARDGFGRTYTGCRWLYSREYDQIRKWLTPGWFITAQALVTISVIVASLASIFGIVLVLSCIPDSAKKWVALMLSLSCYAIALFMIIGLVYFGSHGDTDRTWLKHPTYRHLGWSFYVAAIGGIISILAGMCYTVLYVLVRRERHNVTAYRAHEMRHYRAENTQNSERSYRPERDQYSERDYHSDNGHRSERDYPADDYRSDRDYHDGRRSEKSHRSNRDRDYHSDQEQRSDRDHRDSHRSNRSHRSEQSGRGHRSENSHGRSSRY